MIVLDDDDLGELELECDPFVVASFQIGSAAVRPVMRNRALANGTFDDTRFSGSRAVTVALRLNDSRCKGQPMQDLFDRVLPYMKARRRPRMRWTLPGSTSERELVVRGDNAPVVIAGPKYPVLSLSFVGANEIMSPGEFCQLLDPGADVELGRTYDLAFDRSYPASAVIGDRLINHAGNDDAHWVASIFGIVTNPTLKVNGITINFNVNGGLDLIAGTSVVIDTRARTIFLNGDPASPRYDKTNFTAWSWEDLLLKPGDNTVRFGGSVLGAGGSANLCWRSTWAG